MSFTHAVSTNSYGPAKIIVATSAANGTHTTLASALAAASSGDTVFLRDSVTENVTITPGVNIASFSSDTLNTPTIIGKITMTGAGTSTITNVKLQTNSDFCVVVSGSSASILNLDQCYIKAANNTAISFTSSSSSAEINLSYCQGSLDTTGIAYFVNSSAGSTRMRHCHMRNPGGSVTASTFSAGTLDITWTQFSNPITSSSTASMGGYFSNFQFSSLNVTALTAGGSGNHEFRFCSFISDTASAVSISSSCNLYDCVVYSTNTNAITGAGTLNFSNLTFSGSSSTINTTTQTSLYANLGKYRATKQPAFLAYVTTTITNVTGDGTTYTVIFDTEVYDQSSDFNLGTSTLTAPVTGKYLLSFCPLIVGATSPNGGFVIINTSNATYRSNMPFAPAVTTTLGSNISVIADMDLGDTAVFQVSTSGDTKIDDVAGTSSGVVRTWVSGQLTC